PLDPPVLLDKLRVGRLLPSLGATPADAQPVQQRAQPRAADGGDDRLLDEVVAQLGQRPAGHADQGHGAGDGDLGDLLEDIGLEAAGLCLAAHPGVPEDAVEATLVEAVDDDANPLGRTVTPLPDVTVFEPAARQQDDSGMPAVDAVGLLPLQP